MDRVYDAASSDGAASSEGAASSDGAAAANSRQVCGGLGGSVLLALGLLLPVVPAQAAGYYVYCANDRIEVDSRSPDQMRIARGSGVCMFGSFDYLSDANDLAEKQFGGKDARCTCGRGQR